MKTPSLSVILPCFNEEEVIVETYRRMKAVMVANRFDKHELIFVNDGSRDKTAELLAAIAAKDKNVKIISFSRNFGHQPAVTAGINNCGGDYALIIDADLQDPPELLPEMLKKAMEGNYSVVYGTRLERKGESFFKKMTARMFYRFLNSLSEIKLPLDTGDFRLIDRKVIDGFNGLKEKNKYIRGLISWVGYKQAAFPYVREKRFAGQTKYPLSKMIKFATNGFLYFTKKPLTLAMSLGSVSILIGLALTIYVFVAKFTKLIQTVPGWSSMIIAVVFFGGVQLITIGLLGQYIGSIFDEVKDRPEYVIEKKINFKK
jgi:polyisoprenyl-phosphate glycosyltransferase